MSEILVENANNCEEYVIGLANMRARKIDHLEVSLESAWERIDELERVVRETKEFTEAHFNIRHFTNGEAYLDMNGVYGKELEKAVRLFGIELEPRSEESNE